MAGDAPTVFELRDVLVHATRLADRLATEPKRGDVANEEFEVENQQLAAANVELESQVHRMTTLWVAATRLHESLELEKVTDALREILIGLVGSEEFAVLLHDPAAQEFVPIACEGDPALVGRFHECVSEIGLRLSAADVTRWDGEVTARGLPLLAVPLRIEERHIGGILIFKLLDHKESFTELDQELFELLARQAATALHAAQLHFDSQRKLATLRGVIDEFIAGEASRASARSSASLGGAS